MSLSEGDIKFRKSVIQTDTDVNGGRKGMALVLSGARHSFFPRVTKSQRENGLIRYRKQFYCNENGDDLSAYGVLVYLMRPSNADDRFYIAKGTQTDVQGVFKRKNSVAEYADSRWDRVWTGCGKLAVALSGGEVEVSLEMESDDFQFPNGGYLYLSNNSMVSQTIDADVSIGNSVYFSGGSWSKVAHANDITYPYGWYVGNNEVLTMQESSNEAFLQIADNLTEDESIGTGNGTTTSPTLSALTNSTNEVCKQAGKTPVVTATCGGVTRTVNVAADGTCSGYCSDGVLNMATGAWTTDIVWDTAPDDTSDITVTYREEAFSYSGNTVTIELGEQVADAFAVDSTYGSGCLHEDELQCVVSDFEVNSTQGTYDSVNHEVSLNNKGTVQENWTLSFTGASTFSVSGAYYGSAGTGDIGSNFAPINPETGEPYFTVAAAGWGGTFESGDTVIFTTSPAALPILVEQEVPVGTTQEPNNLLPIGSYTE